MDEDDREEGDRHRPGQRQGEDGHRRQDVPVGQQQAQGCEEQGQGEGLAVRGDEDRGRGQQRGPGRRGHRDRLVRHAAPEHPVEQRGRHERGEGGHDQRRPGEREARHLHDTACGEGERRWEGAGPRVVGGLDVGGLRVADGGDPLVPLAVPVREEVAEPRTGRGRLEDVVVERRAVDGPGPGRQLGRRREGDREQLERPRGEDERERHEQPTGRTPPPGARPRAPGHTRRDVGLHTGTVTTAPADRDGARDTSAVRSHLPDEQATPPAGSRRPAPPRVILPGRSSPATGRPTPAMRKVPA